MSWLDVGNFVGNVALGGLGLFTQKQATDAQIKANQDNLAFQKENAAYQKTVDQFNMNMANKQFDAQMALNERNSITGQTAEMARNGLNPLAGSGIANGSGSVTNSQVASGVQSVVAPNDFSAMSQLGSQMSQIATSGLDRRNAKKMNDAGLQNAQILATLTDKNNIAKLLMECIENGIDPQFLNDVVSSTPDANAKFNYSGLNSFNKTKLINKAKSDEYDMNQKKVDLDMSDPAKLLEAFGLDDADSSKLARAMVGIIRLLK